MKKILYIITRIEKSGPNRVLENMISGIDGRKYKIYILFLFNSSTKYESSKKVKYINLGLKNYFDAFIRGKKLITKIEKEIRPDIIHSHGILPDYINSISNNQNKITTLHCNIYEDYKYAHNKIIAWIMIKLHLIFLSKLNNVVCCSKTVYNGMKISNLTNLMFIENGIKMENNSKNNIKEKLGIKKDELVFSYVGSLSKRKNVQTLVKLAIEHFKKNEHLIILGDGELRDELISCTSSFKNVHILGFKNNVNDYLTCSDVYFSASLAEGLSISVIEALECGLLLLLSDIGSHQEFFYKDETYIGETFNESNFTEKLNIIREKIQKVNKKSLINYKEKYFSDISMMKKYEELYEKK